MNVKETELMYLEVGKSDMAQPSRKQIFVNVWFPCFFSRMKYIDMGK